MHRYMRSRSCALGKLSRKLWCPGFAEEDDGRTRHLIVVDDVLRPKFVQEANPDRPSRPQDPALDLDLDQE